MNCIFCNKTCKQLPNHGQDECANCSPGWTVRYRWSGFASNAGIDWLAIMNAVSHIEIDFQDKQTRVFKWVIENDSGRYKPIIAFDHIEEVSPTTAQQWLDRILKLKAFF